MTRRILLATVGGMAGTSALAGILALSPWRPDGLWVALVILGLLVPTAAAVGTAGALRLSGVADHKATARLTGIGAVATTLFWMFALIAIFSTAGPGAQQAAAMALGGASSGALAARFT